MDTRHRIDSLLHRSRANLDLVLLAAGDDPDPAAGVSGLHALSRLRDRPERARHARADCGSRSSASPFSAPCSSAWSAARWTVAIAVARAGHLRASAFSSRESPGLRWRLGAATIVACLWLLIVILPQEAGSIGTGIGFAFVVDLILRALRGTLDLPWMPGWPEASGHDRDHRASSRSPRTSTSAPDRISPLEGSVCSELTLYRNRFRSRALVGCRRNSRICRTSIGARPPRRLRAPGHWRFAGTGGRQFLVVGLDFHPPRSGPHRPCWDWIGALAALAWLGRLESLARPDRGSGLRVRRCHADHAMRHRARRTQRSRTLAHRRRAHHRRAPASRVHLSLLRPHRPDRALARSPRGSHGRLHAWPSRSSTVTLPVRATLKRAIPVAAVAVLLTFGWLLWDEPGSSVTSAETAALTVMTFNIQEGFSNENIWSLEETARTIESFESRHRGAAGDHPWLARDELGRSGPLAGRPAEHGLRLRRQFPRRALGKRDSLSPADRLDRFGHLLHHRQPPPQRPLSRSRNRKRQSPRHRYPPGQPIRSHRGAPRSKSTSSSSSGAERHPPSSPATSTPIPALPNGRR